MDVEIKLEPGRATPKVIILTGEMTEQVADLARRLAAGESRFLPARQGEPVVLLEPADIYRIYAQGQQVLARLAEGTAVLRFRLYELEERLSSSGFLRISHAELVNFSKVKHLDLSMAGTIRLRMDNGDATYVSRRYMGRIKQYLGI